MWLSGLYDKFIYMIVYKLGKNEQATTPLLEVFPTSLAGGVMWCCPSSHVIMNMKTEGTATEIVPTFKGMFSKGQKLCHEMG